MLLVDNFPSIFKYGREKNKLLLLDRTAVKFEKWNVKQLCLFDFT